MAKRNQFEGMTQQQIDSFKMQKKYTMFLVVVFMLMMFAGVMLSITNACGWYTDEELGLVSGTSVTDVVSDSQLD